MSAMVVQADFDDLSRDDEWESEFDLSLLWTCDGRKVLESAVIRDLAFLQSEVAEEGTCSHQGTEEFYSSHTFDMLNLGGPSIFDGNHAESSPHDEARNSVQEDFDDLQ